MTYDYTIVAVKSEDKIAERKKEKTQCIKILIPLSLI